MGINSCGEGLMCAERSGPGSSYGRDSGRSGALGSGGGSRCVVFALLGFSVGCVSGFQGGCGRLG